MSSTIDTMSITLYILLYFYSSRILNAALLHVMEYFIFFVKTLKDLGASTTTGVHPLSMIAKLDCNCCITLCISSHITLKNTQEENFFSAYWYTQHHLHNRLHISSSKITVSLNPVSSLGDCWHRSLYHFSLMSSCISCVSACVCAYLHVCEWRVWYPNAFWCLIL